MDYHAAIVEPRPLSCAPPLTCLFIIQVAVPRVVTNVVEWMVVGIVRSNCGRITVVTTSLLTYCIGSATGSIGRAPANIVRANVRNVLFVSNRTCVQNAFVIFPNVKRTSKHSTFLRHIFTIDYLTQRSAVCRKMSQLA